MSILTGCDKLGAVLRRDLLTSLRHRNGAIVLLAGVAAELAGFYYLARAIGPTFRPDGLDYYSFLLIGTAMFGFMIGGMSAFVRAVEEAQMTGTMEVLMTTSTPAPVLIFLSAISTFAGNTAQLMFYLAGGLLLAGSLPASPNIPGCIVIFGLSVVIAAAIGILAAALQLAIQKGSALVWLLGSGVWFMTGALFPVTTLPKPLQLLADLIPITHSLNAMRLALLQGAGFFSLRSEIVILALFCLVLLPMSLWIFSLTLRRARLEGTLSFY